MYFEYKYKFQIIAVSICCDISRNLEPKKWGLFAIVRTYSSGVKMTIKYDSHQWRLLNNKCLPQTNKQTKNEPFLKTSIQHGVLDLKDFITSTPRPLASRELTFDCHSLKLGIRRLLLKDFAQRFQAHSTRSIRIRF